MTEEDIKDRYAPLILEYIQNQAPLTAQGDLWNQLLSECDIDRVRHYLSGLHLVDRIGAENIFLHLVLAEQKRREAFQPCYLERSPIWEEFLHYKDDKPDSDFDDADPILFVGSVGQPWWEFVGLLCTNIMDMFDQWVNEDNFSCGTLSDYIEHFGLGLYKQMRDHSLLDAGSAYRLWWYFYTQFAWRMFIDDVNPAGYGTASDFFKSHQVYFLMPEASAIDDEPPVWVRQAEHNRALIVQRGEWSAEVLEKARIFPSGRLAVTQVV
ncbi:hypothetical protein LTR85_003576 [Meristemomyces frigidus]|nr:hypothetical protein LTR85_003576 [Meristemomyces frigidus]